MTLVSPFLRDALAPADGVTSWRTRFAPAPTGWLHLGHAVNAVFVWGLARAFGGRVVLRIEDHDRGRCRAEYEQGLLDDLDWLGLEPDEGATHQYRARSDGLRQSDRAAVYAGVLARLTQQGLVYPCACSRRDIAAATPDEFGIETRYPGTCRTAGVDPSSTGARRVHVAPGSELFVDLARGPQTQDPSDQCGDILVCDRAGNWTYQFAVVVDDIVQRIDVVIRGEDLLASTGRQIYLARLIGRAVPPRFLHHRLVVRGDGAKLSKSDGDTGLRDLRAAGWTPERTLGEAARLAGLQATARSLRASELPGLFE